VARIEASGPFIYYTRHFLTNTRLNPAQLQLLSMYAPMGRPSHAGVFVLAITVWAMFDYRYCSSNVRIVHVFAVLHGRGGAGGLHYLPPSITLEKGVFSQGSQFATQPASCCCGVWLLQTVASACELSALPTVASGLRIVGTNCCWVGIRT
jgi:hypothetical protein